MGMIRNSWLKGQRAFHTLSQMEDLKGYGVPPGPWNAQCRVPENSLSCAAPGMAIPGAAIVWGMAENATHGQRPDPRLFRAVWVGVGLLALVALGLAAWAWGARGGGQVSDPIFDAARMDADWMAGGADVDSGKSLGLRPDLRSAEVVIPDRPHDPEEAPTPEMKAGFSRLRTFTISTDGQGLRVSDSAGETAGVGEKTGFRIVCIGASVSFGWGVSFEESYPALLGDMLGVEVINAGVGGSLSDEIVHR